MNTLYSRKFVLLDVMNRCDNFHKEVFQSYLISSQNVWGPHAIFLNPNILWCMNKHYYHKVASSRTSRLEAQAGFFRLLMKVFFDPYVLWPFDKKLILVTCVRTRVYMVCNLPGLWAIHKPLSWNWWFLTHSNPLLYFLLFVLFMQ